MKKRKQKQSPQDQPDAKAQTPVIRLDGFPDLPRLLPPGWLRSLGVYGYDEVEDLILTALVTGDPLLLVGKAGTGKTFLLNSLSEALGLEHRHYNASLIAFDDLVGFPYPEEGGASIRYIQTPATVWQAESVLIDELSRCKPEHQNRLFSLVHERRIQGLDLPNLRYRWAAMNPCEAEDGDEFYDGSVALDQALADRFALLIEVPDWDAMTEDDRSLVADARGIGAISVDGIGLVRAVEEGRRRFENAPDRLHEAALTYASAVATQLLKPSVRLSPRRVRLLSRNLVASTLVSGGVPGRDGFYNTLARSLPQPGWGVRVEDSVLRGAHATAWDLLTRGQESRWLSAVLSESRLAKRCTELLANAPSPDVAAMAIRQSLVQLPKPEAAILALALLPVIKQRPDDFGQESLAAVVETAAPVLEVQSEAKWRLRDGLEPQANPHPTLTACAAVLEGLPPRRRTRATQLFYHCIAHELPIDHPEALERTLDETIRAAKPFTSRTNKP